MNLPRLLLRSLIRAYQLLISPLLPPNSCRFIPSCSCYASEAIAIHGSTKGSWLAMKRLSRCHPWGGHGYDPVVNKISCPEHSCESPS